MSRKTCLFFALALLVSSFGLHAATAAPCAPAADLADELAAVEMTPVDAVPAVAELTPEPLFASTASCYDTCQAAYESCLGGECNFTRKQCSSNRSQCYGCCNLQGVPCLAC